MKRTPLTKTKRLPWSINLNLIPFLLLLLPLLQFLLQLLWKKKGLNLLQEEDQGGHTDHNKRLLPSLTPNPNPNLNPSLKPPPSPLSHLAPRPISTSNLKNSLILVSLKTGLFLLSPEKKKKKKEP